jgi:hypothetical protein
VLAEPRAGEERRRGGRLPWPSHWSPPAQAFCGGERLRVGEKGLSEFRAKWGRPWARAGRRRGRSRRAAGRASPRASAVARNRGRRREKGSRTHLSVREREGRAGLRELGSSRGFCANSFSLDFILFAVNLFYML